MRKIYLFILLCSIWLGVTAQNSQKLTANRNAYRAADQIMKQEVKFRDPGSMGKALHWDFSMLQPINENYSLKYFSTDSMNMTHLCGEEHNTRYYFRQQQDSLQAVGFENSTTFMVYPVPELRMHFPFAYGDTLFSYFVGKGEYCHRIPLKVKGYTRIIADAEGEMLLPQNETVTNALRVQTLRHYTQTGKDSVEMTLDTYSWYAVGIRYPVFESIKTTIQKGKSDTTIFNTSFYYPPEKQTSQVLTDPIPKDSILKNLGAASVFTQAQLMPNPVVDNLNISYKLTRQAKIWFTVHNNIGIQLCITSPKNQNSGNYNSSVPMSNLIPGIYSLYVHVDDMILRLNLVKK